MPDPVLLKVPVTDAVLLRESVVEAVPELVIKAVGDTLGVLENVPVTVCVGVEVWVPVPDPEPDPVRVCEGVFVLEGVCVEEPVFDGVVLDVTDDVIVFVGVPEMVLVIVWDGLVVKDGVTEGLCVLVGVRVAETEAVPVCV